MNGVDAIEQVLAEFSLSNPFVKVSIRSTNQADIHGNRLIASHPHHTTALEDGQQLGLQMIGQVAYLVEENRPFVGSLELTRPVGMGIGEGSLLVTEQLALE